MSVGEMSEDIVIIATALDNSQQPVCFDVCF